MKNILFELEMEHLFNLYLRAESQRKYKNKQIIVVIQVIVPQILCHVKEFVI